MAKLRITYRKSAIGFSKDQKETVRSLGLRKLNSVAIQEDTPAIRGMIFKVQHLVAVEEVSGDVQPDKKAAPKTTIVRARETGAASSVSTVPTTSATAKADASETSADDASNM
jgi:large subunit ribosomal protein L30